MNHAVITIHYADGTGIIEHYDKPSEAHQDARLVSSCGHVAFTVVSDKDGDTRYTNGNQS